MTIYSAGNRGLHTFTVSITNDILSMKNTNKKAVVATIAPAKNTKKVANTKATETKKVAPVVENSLEVVEVATTTYHYWRNWVKDIARDGSVISAKFVKGEGYNGTITVVKSEVSKLKEVFTKYQKENPGIIAMWTLI